MNKKEINLGRITTAAMVSIPVEFIFLIIGLGIMHPTYMRWNVILRADNRIMGMAYFHFERLLEFWFIALGIHLIHLALYALLAIFCEIKIKYEILVASITAFAFSAISLYVRDGDFLGFGYMATYSFLFSMIMFIIFTIVSSLIDKYKDWGEMFSALLSFIVSVFVSWLISYGVWTVLYH